MTRHSWGSIWPGLFAVFLLLGACSSTAESEEPAAPRAEDAPAPEAPAEDSTPASVALDPAEDADDSATDEADEGALGIDTGSQAAMLGAEAVPLGDVVGVSRPVGEEPTLEIVDSFERLCPSVMLSTDVVLQSDPLVTNFPVQRHIVLFSSADEATAFVDEIEATGGPGCVVDRETEVSIGTTTVEELSVLNLDGREVLRITAQVDVDMINLDRDPPGAKVQRYVAQEGNAVVVVVALATYQELVGVDVMEPLILDGLALVGEVGG